MAFRLWYSRNAKNALQAAHTPGSSGGFYWEWIYGDKNFKSLSGTDYTYLRVNTSGQSETLARSYGAAAMVGLSLPGFSGITPVFKVCMDESTFDDNKYNYSGEISGPTVSLVHTSPQTFIYTITNGGDTDITFNALEFGASGFMGSNDVTNSGTAVTVLKCAIISDEPITIPAGSSYQINVTIE